MLAHEAMGTIIINMLVYTYGAQMTADELMNTNGKFVRSIDSISGHLLSKLSNKSVYNIRPYQYCMCTKQAQE